jgi:hypothetical protein
MRIAIAVFVLFVIAASSALYVPGKLVDYHLGDEAVSGCGVRFALLHCLTLPTDPTVGQCHS